MDKFYLNNKEEINRIKVKVKVLVTQSCPTLCNPKNCSPPGSSVHGILQARILEWAAISFSRGYSPPSDQTWVSCIAGRFFTTEPPGDPDICYRMIFIFRKSTFISLGEVKVSPPCLTLCDHVDCSLPDSSVHGILQARILEWVAISFSMGSS